MREINSENPRSIAKDSTCTILQVFQLVPKLHLKYPVSIVFFAHVFTGIPRVDVFCVWLSERLCLERVFGLRESNVDAVTLE